MHCRNCGKEVPSITTRCTSCDTLPLSGTNYCQECGYPTKEGQEVCTACTNRLKFAPSPPSQVLFSEESEENIPKAEIKSSQVKREYVRYEEAKVVDEANVGANIAACCSIPFTGGLPVVGFILYLVWYKEKPKAAKSVCLWSVIPFIGLMLIFIIFFIIGMFSSTTSYPY